MKVPKRYLAIIVQRFSFQHHAAILLVCTALAAFLISRYLDSYGIDTPVLRYPLVSFLSFYVFMILLFIWKRFALQNFSIEHHSLIRDVLKHKEPRPSQKQTSRYSFTEMLDGLDWVDMPDIDGWEFVIFAVICILALGTVTYSFIVDAPLLLAELFLQGVLGSSLYKAVEQVDHYGWTVQSWWKIIKAFVGMILLSFVAGFMIQAICPQATRFKDLFSQTCGWSF